MRYELWLSLRYLLAKRRERFISVIAVLSIGGVALGVMALLVVLSVMSGFDYDLREKLVGANAHLSVQSASGIRDVEAVIRTIAASEHVDGVAPFVTGQAIVRLPQRAFGVLVRGLDVPREVRVSKLREYLVMGHLPQADDEAVVGTEFARFVGVGPGDRVQLVSPADGRMHELIVSGVFRSGMYEYDAGLIGVTIRLAQALFGLPEGTVSGVAVRLDALERAETVKGQLAAKLQGPYEVKTWMELNQTLFDALKLEKLTMSVILTLIVLVAAVNIVSTLIMMVIEKTRDIGILKSIGASNRSVRAIFIWQGVVIGAAGTLLGLAGAWVLVWLLDTYQFIRLPSTIYYLDHLPVRIEWADWMVTAAAAAMISLLSTVYPAGQAARLAPVEALRYE